MKRLLTALLITAVCFTAVAAFQERFVPIQNKIDLDETARFNLTITNNDQVDHTYRLSLSVDQTTNWLLSPNSLRVEAGSSRTTTVSLRPKGGTQPGSYFTQIQIEGEGDQRSIAAPISLGQGGPRQFVPNVGMTMTNDENVDPREPFPISFEFHNRNRRDLDNLTLTVNSELFTDETTFSLDGLERKGQNIFFTLNDTTRPDNYTINANIFFDQAENPITSYSSQFNILSYSDISIDQTTEEGWFRTRYNVTLHNDGNVERTYTYNVSAPWFERLFLSSPQDTTLETTDGGTVKQWTLTLDPMGEQTLTYERNYQGLALTIFTIVVAVIAYFVFRSPVVAYKEGKIVKNPNGADKLRVRVYLRNRSSKEVYNVSVTDNLPSILEYDDFDDVGYISPSTVRKKRKGETTVHWDIDKLDSLEERILVYEATPRLEVLGDVDLPSVKVQFENENGRVSVYESWTTSAGSDDEFLEQK